MNPPKPVILCVDDEEANLRLIEKLLVPRGYVVVSADNGKDALLKIRSQAINLVLLDIIMPGMNGFEVCRQIKEDQKLRNIPVIMITALSAKQDRIRGIEAGAEEFLSKPFDQTEVLARIKILLRIKTLDDDRKHAESQREAALVALQKSHDELDSRVRERTAELAQANEILKADIIKRKQTEVALKESEKKYRLLADNVNDVIFVLDMNLNYTYVSPSVKILRGYEPEEVLKQKSIEQTLTPSSQALAMTTFSEIMELEKAGKREIPQSQILQLEMIRKDGTTVWTEVKLSFIRDQNQQPVGIMGLTRDITERRKAEQELQKTLESLRKAVGATIQVMVSAIEMRDPYTSGHQLRVANLACDIAKEMGLPQDKTEGLRMAGSIHDIGKLSVPAEILTKSTKLTNIEFSMIKEHSQKGYEMLKNVESPWPLAQIVYQHHERMDGSGYPRSLKGDEILMEARIMAVADVVEAMASHRPYRPSLGIDAALAEIEKNKGIHYDNTVVNVCLKLFKEKGYTMV